MNKTTQHKLATALACSALALGANAACAEDQPSGAPITIVVPYAPGGTADALPRLVAQKLPAILGAPVVVLNKPGAAGILGADYVAQSAPDGRTLLVVPPHFFVYDLLYKIKFDPSKFKPVSILATYPNVLLVGPKWSGKNLKEFIEAAKASPQPLAAGSPGVGTSQHLSAEMLRMMTDIQYLHVAYKGSGPAMTDLMGGQLDFIFDNLITAQPFVTGGRLKLLGVGSKTRSPLFPDVPAIDELVPGYESVTWMGIVAPPGTPKAMVDKLSTAFSQAVKMPDVSAQITGLQAEPVGNTSPEMQQVVGRDVERWTKVIKSAGVKAE
jgi:tripartite-type tricarboxylate transporter receptor subunit TctC